MSTPVQSTHPDTPQDISQQPSLPTPPKLTTRSGILHKKTPPTKRPIALCKSIAYTKRPRRKTATHRRQPAPRVDQSTQANIIAPEVARPGDRIAATGHLREATTASQARSPPARRVHSSAGTPSGNRHRRPRADGKGTCFVQPVRPHTHRPTGGLAPWCFGKRFDISHLDPTIRDKTDDQETRTASPTKHAAAP